MARIKIHKPGITRTCDEKEFYKYKKQGFEKVEETLEEELGGDFEEVDFYEFTNAELKEMLKKQDKPIYGNKDELVERLRE